MKRFEVVRKSALWIDLICQPYELHPNLKSLCIRFIRFQIRTQVFPLQSEIQNNLLFVFKSGAEKLQESGIH